MFCLRLIKQYFFSIILLFLVCNHLDADGKRRLLYFNYLSDGLTVCLMCLFLIASRVGLQCVVGIVLDHIHLLFIPHNPRIP